MYVVSRWPNSALTRKAIISLHATTCFESATVVNIMTVILVMSGSFAVYGFKTCCHSPDYYIYANKVQRTSNLAKYSATIQLKNVH